MSLGFVFRSFIIIIILLLILLLLLLLLLLPVLLLISLLLLLLLLRIALLKFQEFFGFFCNEFYSGIILAPRAQCVCNFVFLFVFYRDCTFYLTVLLFIVANRFQEQNLKI